MEIMITHRNSFLGPPYVSEDAILTRARTHLDALRCDVTQTSADVLKMCLMACESSCDNSLLGVMLFYVVLLLQMIVYFIWDCEGCLLHLGLRRAGEYFLYLGLVTMNVHLLRVVQASLPTKATKRTCANSGSGIYIL